MNNQDKKERGERAATLLARAQYTKIGEVYRNHEYESKQNPVGYVVPEDEETWWQNQQRTARGGDSSFLTPLTAFIVAFVIAMGIVYNLVW